MDLKEFRNLFVAGEVLQSGGDANRKNASRLQILRIDDDLVRFRPVNAKTSFRVSFEYIDLLLANFEAIDPYSIQKSVNRIRLRHGLKRDTTTENYAYGFTKSIH